MIRSSAFATLCIASLLAGCVGGGEPVQPPQPDPAPSRAPSIPRLTNASWPGVASAIASLDEILSREQPVLRDGNGRQFVMFQHAPIFDLARGWLREAPYDAANAFDYVRRAELESSGRSWESVRAEHDEIEADLLARLSGRDGSLCGMAAGYLLAQAVAHGHEIAASAEAGESDAALVRQEAYRWARMRVAREITGEECSPAPSDAHLRAWIERLNGEAATRAAVGDAAVDDFNRNLTAWAEREGLNATTGVLLLREAMRLVIRVADADAAPTLESIAALAARAHDSKPEGLRAWAYAVGTNEYDNAAQGRALRIDDPRMRWITYLCFAIASGDPESHFRGGHAIAFQSAEASGPSIG